MNNKASATAKKAAARRKTLLAARGAGLLPPHLERMAEEAIAAGYGPDGHMQGSERHRVKSVADIAKWLRERAEAQRGLPDAA